MNRKQKALEERYRQQGKTPKLSKPLYREFSVYDPPLTKEDITYFFKELNRYYREGYWFYGDLSSIVFPKEKKKQEQISVLFGKSKKIWEKRHEHKAVRTNITTEEDYKELEEIMLNEFVYQNSKLAKVLM